MDQSQDVLQPGRGNGLQHRANLCRAALKLLNKLLQIADQMLLIGDEIGGFHLLVGTGTIKFPQIVLVILTQALKILL